MGLNIQHCIFDVAQNTCILKWLAKSLPRQRRSHSKMRRMICISFCTVMRRLPLGSPKPLRNGCVLLHKRVCDSKGTETWFYFCFHFVLLEVSNVCRMLCAWSSFWSFIGMVEAGDLSCKNHKAPRKTYERKKNELSQDQFEQAATRSLVLQPHVLQFTTHGMTTFWRRRSRQYFANFCVRLLSSFPPKATFSDYCHLTPAV